MAHHLIFESGDENRDICVCHMNAVFSAVITDKLLSANKIFHRVAGFAFVFYSGSCGEYQSSSNSQSPGSSCISTTHYGVLAIDDNLTLI